MSKKPMDKVTKESTEIEGCRVMPIGVKDFAECLLPGPNTCSYALPFGYCFLCHHPKLSDIIENSKKAPTSTMYAN